MKFDNLLFSLEHDASIDLTKRMFKFLAVFAALSQCLVTPSTVLEKDVITDLALLPLDGNGRLAENWFLFLDTPECKAAFSEASILTNTRLRRIAAVSSNASRLFYPDSLSKCSAVSIAVGTNPTFFKHLLESSKLEILEEDIDVETVAAWIVGIYKLNTIQRKISPEVRIFLF